MKKLQLFLLVLLSLTLCTLTPMKVKASHGGGGELIYQWISDSTYRFFFKFYRDCTGIGAGGPWQLCATPSASCVNATAFQSSMTYWTGPLVGGGQNGSALSSGCAGPL